MRQIFIDLDGVLADFDGHYEKCFGIRPNRTSDASMKANEFDPEFWGRIQRHGTFFHDLPMMNDAMELWDGVKQYSPVILTGLPHSVKDVDLHKRDWVSRHINMKAGSDMICTTSKRKYEHCKSGDILIDDWFKWRHRWEEAGGIFILHRSASDSLAALRGVLGVVTGQHRKGV